jgi:CRISPR-associated protein Cas2
MWILVMFDLPVDTKKARLAYTRFRTAMVRDGFAMMQYSVYARHCASEENANVHVARVERTLPNDGEVRIISLTDKQMERMRTFWGKTRAPTQEVPKQLELF